MLVLIVDVKPAISQILWHIDAALSDFETLKHDPETMIAAASGELQTLKNYLEAIKSVNQGLAIRRDSQGNPILNLKGFVCDYDFLD